MRWRDHYAMLLLLLLLRLSPLLASPMVGAGEDKLVEEEEKGKEQQQEPKGKEQQQEPKQKEQKAENVIGSEWKSTEATALQQLEEQVVMQTFRVRPENTQVRLGENVYMCCIVDHQQGKAQWTKDGFALGFNRTVPGYPRYKYVGNETIGEHHLVIRGATLEDEGEYECQVGPTATQEAIWSGANVTVMVPPRKIVMVGWGDGATVEVTQGTKLKLECLLMDAKPAPTVAWYRNTLRIDPSHHYEMIEESQQMKMVSVRSFLVLRAESGDDGHQYSCRAIHPAIVYSQPPLVAAIRLAVFHPPGRPVISEYMTGQVLRAGESRILVCHVLGGNPSPRVMWYRHGRPLNQEAAAAAAKTNSRGRRNGLVTSAHPARQLKASGGVFVSQQVTATREEDGAVYECRVNSDLLHKPYTTNVTLTVHYPPSHVEVRGPAAVSVGEEFTVTCITAPASPPATITWIVHGTSIAKGNATVTEDYEGGWVTTSTLTKRLVRTLETHDMTEASVECRAEHPTTIRSGVRGSHVINILERPGEPQVEVEGNGKVMSGDEVALVCSSTGGNPAPELTIYKGTERLQGVTVKTEGGVTWARVKVEVNASDNGEKITCEAANLATSIPIAGQAILKVNFPPWEVRGWANPRSVEVGHVVKLSCESSASVPPSVINWHSPGVALNQPSAKHSPGQFGGTVTRSKVRVRVRAEDQGRIITCEADNGLGVTVATNITLDVLHGPVWVFTPVKFVDVPEGSDVVVTASAEANPGPVKYRWYHGHQKLEGIETETGDGLLKLENVQRDMGGNYSVSASSVHGAITSSFTVNVLYAPENLSVPERVLADRNETVSIQCVADGNPAPNVTWTRAADDTNTVLAAGVGEAQLVIDWATSADTGIYLCHAANEVASIATPARTAFVVPQAPSRPIPGLDEWEDDLDVEDDMLWTGKAWAVLGGAGVLDCRVRASPQPTFNWTTADGRPVVTGEKYLIHFPQLVDDVAEWSSVLEVRDITTKDFANFTCTATNSLGSLDIPISLHRHTRHGAPLVLNVTVVSDSGVVVTWSDATEGPAPAGYTIRLRTDQHPQYQLVDVPGTNTSSWEVKGLTTGARYSFTVQSYNQQGRPYHTSPPVEVLMKADYEAEDETPDEADKPDDGVKKEPEGISLLMFVLIALTGFALFVLNITGILCYLRRRSFFQGLSVGSSRKDSAYEVPSPSFVDELSLSSNEDIPPPDYEVTPPLQEQQVMGTLSRVSFGGSLVDVRRASGSRGTPSLARSSPIVTSSSTISAMHDLDIDEIIAPPDDFSNGLISLPSDEGLPTHSERDSWADLEDDMSSPESRGQRTPVCELPIIHQPTQHLSEGPSTSYAAATFHHSMESLSQMPIQPPQTTTQTFTLPSHTYPTTQPSHSFPTTQPLTLHRPPSHVIYHGQPHLQQQFEQQQQQEQFQQQQQQMVLQQHQYFQYPQPQSETFGYPTQPLTGEEHYYLQQQQQQQLAYRPPPSEPTTPLTPSYASLDPSTLYALHSTMFSDGSRSTSTFTDQQAEGSPPVQTTESFPHT